MKNRLKEFLGLKNIILSKPELSPIDDKYRSYLFKHLEIDKKIVLVDVGAHNGAFTDLVFNYCGIEKGLLIEPLDKSFIFISEKYSDKAHFVLLKKVIGDRNGTEVKFFVNSFEETSSLLKIRNIKELEGVDIDQKEEVILKMKTLDSVCEENGFDEIDLIKIDVQGAEHLVLDGATNVLKKAKMVWIENSFKPLYEASSVFGNIYEKMNNFDFYLAEVSPGHKSSKGELLQIDTLYKNNKYVK
jgi:FkbM family methyltransferase